MKIIAFGASYSKHSINKRFATYVARQFGNHNLEILDLNEYDLPLFTVDVLAESGLPEMAKQFVQKLDDADFIIISLSEHNGSYSAAFKNLFDWASRVKRNMFENKKMLLLSASDGARGGASVMAAAIDRFPRHGALLIGSFSLPDFYQNFNDNEGITDVDLKEKLLGLIDQVSSNL
jgi:chromate reductase, NAD(P)H dehydrogenase (quinone)